MHELQKCASNTCTSYAVRGAMLCNNCHAAEHARKSLEAYELKRVVGLMNEVTSTKRVDLAAVAQKYPKYYKAIPEGMTHIDVYGVHMLFDIQDPSGAIQHASKKLLLSGVRTGGKSMAQDIKEARDALNRWLELYSPS